jgi:membrane-associated phospholipid phosphatase
VIGVAQAARAQEAMPPEDQTGVTFTPRPARNPFTAIGHDLKTLVVSRDTRIVLGTFLPLAAVASSWDGYGIEESQEHLPRPSFEAGNIGGSFLVQSGIAVGTWALGSMTGQPKVTEVGGDLLRAQLTSQVVVQGLKFATQRARPDGSNAQSFPSGHTASAFATATVLERHFGWRAGLPAYGFAAYVGLARMSANKHHMSDVIMGAALGIASARAVTVGVGGTRFSVGVSPTQGGAALNLTKVTK